MHQNLVLHLSLIPGVGPAALQKIMGLYKEHAAFDLYRATAKDLMCVGMSEALAQKIVVALACTKLLDQELALLERNNINIVTLFDPEYPSLLAAIYMPPPILYYKGSLGSTESIPLAVVGSRDANAYGKNCVDFVIPSLIAQGYTIVSGGARGIDTFAHTAALRANGKTLAIIGSGLLRPYPATNKKLFEEIAASGGAVMSPFPLQMEALVGNFPARNRIIAGISQGTLVIQAAEKSGALITADLALKEGREVFAVPGSIFDPLAAGCNKLLAEGAAIVKNAEDVVTVLGTGNSKQTHAIQIARSETISLLQAAKLDSVDPIILFCSKARSYDALLEYTRLEASELNDKLWYLQIEGLVEQNSSGLWKSL